MVRKKSITLCSSSPELSLLEAVSSKWAPLVVLALSQKKMRHSELQRAVGIISQKVLTQTLRTLERNGIITRYVYPVIPPHVEYELRPAGFALVARIEAFGAWAREYYSETVKSRDTFDRRK